MGYRKNLDAAFGAAASTPSASNPLVTAAEQPWEQSANVVQVKSAFGANGVTVGTGRTDYTLNSIKTLDPNSAYISALLHMDDSGLTESSAGRTVTASGGVVRSSTSSKFGGYAAYSGATASGSLLIANGAHFTFGTGAWTISAWINKTSTSNSNIIILPVTGGQLLWQINNAGANAIFYIVYSGVNKTYTFTSPSLNAWHHYEMCYNGTKLRVFLDGSMVASETLALNIPAATGSFNACYDAHPMYIDELAVYKGVCVHDSDDSFTPTGYSMSAAAEMVDLVSSGTINFSPNTLSVTGSGTADGYTIAYQKNSDALSAYYTPAQFRALADSVLAGCTSLKLSFINGTYTVASATLSTPYSSVITSKSGTVSISVNGSTVYAVESDGDIITADITADDIAMTGDLTMDTAVTSIATATTTDGSATVIKSIPIATDKTLTVDVDVIANKTGTTTKEVFRIVGAAVNNSGTITLIGDPVSLKTDATLWTVTLVPNNAGATKYLDVTVTGASSTTIAWSAKICWNVA